MKVLLFGRLTAITGCEEINLEPADDTEQLLTQLYTLFPLLKQQTFSIALNKQMVNTPTTIPADAEIALLPPFSGG